MSLGQHRESSVDTCGCFWIFIFCSFSYTGKLFFMVLCVLMGELRAMVACQYSGLKHYLRQIESGQVENLRQSNRTGSPGHACQPATGWEKQLTVKQPGEGGQRRL